MGNGKLAFTTFSVDILKTVLQKCFLFFQLLPWQLKGLTADLKLLQLFTLALFSSENTIFPMKEKTMNYEKKIFFPTYLPIQNIQDRDTANKQFFKDDLG